MNLTRFPELQDLFSKRWFRVALPGALILGCLISRKQLPSFSLMGTLMGSLFFAFAFVMAIFVGLLGGKLFRDPSVFPFKSRTPVAAFFALGAQMALGCGIRELLDGVIPFDFASAGAAIGFLFTFTRENRGTPQP